MHFKILSTLLLIWSLNFYVTAQSFDAEIIKYSQFCEVEKEKLTKTDSIIIQINNRSGDKYTEINIPYSKNERVSKLEAWVEQANGTIVRTLKKSDIVDKSAISEISLYEDDYVKSFQLKHNVYPYRITYIYQTDYKDYISVNNWTPIVYTEIPTRVAKLKTIFSKGYKFSKYENDIQKIKCDSTTEILTLEWEANYLNPYKSEIYSQPENIWPYVFVVPENFRYGVDGGAKKWSDYGDWQINLMKNTETLPEEEKKRIANLINGITDKREKIKILYHYLQDNTRYINISIGVGGYKPYPASYVAINKYGDCKALTNYMKSILKFAGIESFYTEVYASTQPKQIIENIPGPQFNHVILAVPIGNDTIWLENTNKNNPFGYIGTFTQNRKALLVDKGKSKLVNIPALVRNQNHTSTKMNFELSISGNTKVSLNALYRGSDFEQFNQLHEDYNEDEKDQIIRNYLTFDQFEVEKWNLIKPNRDSLFIQLNADLNLTKVLRPLGNEYYFPLFAGRIPQFSTPEVRTMPVEIPFPINRSDTLTYQLPAGFDLKNTPDPSTLSSNYGKYELMFVQQNQQLTVYRHFELFPARYTKQQYPEFYKFIKTISDIDKKNITIKRRT